MSRTRRKIRKGKLITSLDQLAKCEWVIVNGKPLQRGWWLSWQVRLALHYVKNKAVYEGIRLTNGEYYGHLTDEQLPCRLKDEIGITGVLPRDSEYEQKIKDWKELPVK